MKPETKLIKDLIKDITKVKINVRSTDKYNCANITDETVFINYNMYNNLEIDDLKTLAIILEEIGRKVEGVHIGTFVVLHEISHILDYKKCSEFDWSLKCAVNSMLYNETVLNAKGKERLIAYRNLPIEEDADKMALLIIKLYPQRIKKFDEDMRKLVLGNV